VLNKKVLGLGYAINDFKKLRVDLHLMGYYFCLPKLAFSHFLTRSVHFFLLPLSTITGYHRILLLVSTYEKFLQV